MKWFIAVLAALVLLLQYRVWVSPDGTREVLQLRDAVAAQTAENQRLAARNAQLAAEVRNLKQGFEALEERARSELGLIAGNETYYQVVPPATGKAPPTAEAPKSTALRAAAR
jgi:cell division protein FtsB